MAFGESRRMILWAVMCSMGEWQRLLQAARRISNCGSLWARSSSHLLNCAILEMVTRNALNNGWAQPVPLALFRGEDKQPGSFRGRAQLHVLTRSPGAKQAFV